MPDVGHSETLNNQHISFELKPHNNRRLMMLCGEHDRHLSWLEESLSIKIKYRSHKFSISGAQRDLTQAKQILETLYSDESLSDITLNDYNLLRFSQQKSVATHHQSIVMPRSESQRRLLETIKTHPITLVVGPAGTGKTYLAVAAAADALMQHKIDRIILSRPAVDAGEKLGFLPGDMAQKVDPYIKPLTDSLIDILGSERYARSIERNIIEIAPLAFMRGRTLNNSFIILDEAQNTTPEQMKMFLTRLGHGSTMVITGDLTQIDLPHNQISGLVHATKVLSSIDKIAQVAFDHTDVVRHPLIGQIIKAYDVK